MTYQATTHVPDLVRRAKEAAARHSFTRSCTDEVGQLLGLLASQYESGTIAEIGTGCGVGTAWLASALRPGVSLLTVENDADCAAGARTVFAGSPNVRIVHSDWQDILNEGPFVMLFPDVSEAKNDYADALIGALRPGGLVVLDDLTPEDQWPDEWRGKPDPLRETWLNHPKVRATEILVTASAAVILATRVAQ